MFNLEKIHSYIDNHLDSKTYIGKPLFVKDIILIPICTVTAGLIKFPNNPKDKNGPELVGINIMPKAMIIIDENEDISVLKLENLEESLIESLCKIVKNLKKD